MALSVALNFVTAGEDGKVRFVLNNGWYGTGQQPHAVALRDLAGKPLSDLQKDGFTRAHITSSVSDWDDFRQLEALWFPAVREAVLRATGARWATLFAGPLLRFSNRHPRSTGSSISAPARAVHADLHAGFRFHDVAHQPVAEIAAREVAENFGEDTPARWGVFNIWQMISPPPQDNVLAMCRLGSVSPEDVVKGLGYFDEPEKPADTTLAERAGTHDFDITFFRHNPAHEWCYFSDMDEGDALIFSTYDPEDEGLHARTPHAAIDLDSKANPRRSIEIRALVAW